jgi:hypothetical protein
MKYFYKTDQFTPYILIGPKVDFLIGYNSEEGYFDEILKNYEKTKLEGTFGVGFDFSMLNQLNATFNVRYNFDLTDGYKTDLLKIRGNSLDIGFGVCF